MGVGDAEARAFIAAQEPLLDNGLPQPGAEPTVVWPENWPALGLFLRLQTQWNYWPDGRRQGLRYEAMESAINLQGLSNRAEVFDHLVEMQHEALEALHEL